MARQTDNPKGVVSPQLGADFARLERLAKKAKTKPTALARKLLKWSIGEMEQGKVQLPPDQVIPT